MQPRVVGHLQNIKTSSSLLPLFPLNRLISGLAMCVTERVSYGCGCVCAHNMCILWVFVSVSHASVCLSLALTGVCTLCLMSSCEESVTLCVRGRSGVSCYLHRPMCPFSLSLCHLLVCGTPVLCRGLTPAFVNRGRRGARVIGAPEERERERLTQR